jgi:multiple sugar transport system substrate-binding protein
VKTEPDQLTTVLGPLSHRKDLFKAAGLPEPKTYTDIQNAAKQLNKGKMAGIVAAAAPADSFTQQSFELLRSPTAASLLKMAAISP